MAHTGSSSLVHECSGDEEVDSDESSQAIYDAFMPKDIPDVYKFSKRTGKGTRKARVEKKRKYVKLRAADIAKTTAWRCRCQQNCMENIAYPARVIRDARQELHGGDGPTSGTQAGVVHAILKMFQVTRRPKEGKMRGFALFRKGNTQMVCREAFEKILGVGQRTMQTALNQYATWDGTSAIATADIRSSPTSRRVTKKDVVCAYLRRFAKKYGCHDPTAQHSGKIQVPMAELQEYAQDYNLYMINKVNKPSFVVDFSWFGRIFRTNFPHVRIQRGGAGFKKCSKCKELKELRDKGKTKAVKEEARAALKKHRESANAARDKYDKWIAKAEANPRKYDVLSADGVDQSKFRNPNFNEDDHTTGKLKRVQLACEGVLFHGIGLAAYMFMPHTKHDATFTIHCIMQTLQKVEQKRGWLARELRLQLDNTTRENKNYIMVAFAFILVHFNVYKKVKIGFLIVGHTHTYIDQLFSVWSRALMRAQVFKPTDALQFIMEKCECMFSAEIAVTGDILDFKSWIDGSFNDCNGITDAQMMCFKRSAMTGDVVARFKRFCTDPEWEDYDGTFCTGVPGPLGGSVVPKKILVLPRDEDDEFVMTARAVVAYFEGKAQMPLDEETCNKYAVAADEWKQMIVHGEHLAGLAASGVAQPTPEWVKGFFVARHAPPDPVDEEFNPNDWQDDHQSLPHSICIAPQVPIVSQTYRALRSDADRSIHVGDYVFGMFASAEEAQGRPFYCGKVKRISNGGNILWVAWFTWAKTSGGQWHLPTTKLYEEGPRGARGASKQLKVGGVYARSACTWCKTLNTGSKIPACCLGELHDHPDIPFRRSA
jgi:hypothetical protein